MSTSGSLSWDELRRRTRSLENALETSLTNFNKAAASASNAYSSSGSLNSDLKGEYKRLEEEIKDGLVKLEQLVDQMSALVERDPKSTTTMQHTARRHEEILSDYQRDFRRTQTSLREAEQRSNLLGSVRDEISAFKASTSSSSADTDKLLSERGHIDSSHRMADDILGQAYETRYEFQQQRNMLSGVNTRMNGVLASMPGINSLLNMINARRRRDSLILGTLIGVLLIFLFWYATR